MLATETSAVAAPRTVPLPPENLLPWKRIAGAADPFLQAVNRRLAEQTREFDPEIAAFIEYALTGHGKQLRPLLVALSAGATGTVTDAHALAAVIIEMVHLATLVHDDVMDEARIRRGRPTLAARWGNEIAVLAGDCLFAHALKLAASFPTTEVCRAVATATNTVCSGEIIQTQRQNNFDLTRAEYFQVIQMKTGELFALSCDLGAYLSGAGGPTRTALRQFGLAVGTAYQVYDDCVDLFGSEATVGKSLGTDLVKGKLTLPMLVARERSPAGERARIGALLQDWAPGCFPQVAKWLRQHHALDEARRAVEEHLGNARRMLKALPESASRDALLALTEYLAQQAAALAD